MAATTIKLEGEVFKEIRGAISGKQSITSFVRESVQAELKRRKFREAAIQYQEFLRANEKEASDLALWQAAALEAPVK
ncbi:hypothetical protein [Turneriella parva]|uniref:CopG family transcriptional regulator n=1 Tax=Turneriella parva (strain ATCC BAA-1111 / DSM 21527 / NCTC 11395 / H) TaxID=869212 RepID=I4B2N6_TURPD|nr:hypothetical protein [Turneriella parva]AFM11543.1 hypothetical protein Turpa_0892 [Turneriella parva DSM 21527]